MKSNAILVASAAATLFLLNAATARAAESGGGDKVPCLGVNACKGQGSCHTAKNECAGQNACKGQGVKMMSASACQAEGGKVQEAEKK
jgi:hypothetical protein